MSARRCDILGATRCQTRRFARDESGTTLVELAVVTPMFFVMFLGILDFGRMGGEYVMAQKALQIASRTAVVRPPACAGVPTVNERGPVGVGEIAPRYGTMCSAGANVCASVATVTCTGVMGNATVAEIWGRVSPLLPNGATAATLQFSYAHNSDMGFLGGPYVPELTVELTNLNFTFATPVGNLLAFFGASPTDVPGPAVVFPPMSTSIPGEDLALGNGV